MFKSIQKCPIINSYIEFFAPSFFHIFWAFRMVQTSLPKLRKKWTLQLENYSNMRLFCVFFNHCEYLWILSTDRRMCSWHPRLTRRRSAATPKKVSVAGGTCFRVVIKHQANLKSLEPALYNYVIMLMLPASFNLETQEKVKRIVHFHEGQSKLRPFTRLAFTWSFIQS